MPLSWNEIRQRSITFAREWSQAARERAEAQTFWNEFFHVFGVRRRTVAAFEEPVRNLAGATDFIDLLWPGKLIAEHKSLGGNLSKAHTQAIGYIHSLHNDGRVEEAPRYILVSDFARFALHDLEAEEPAHETLQFALSELPQVIRRFAFIAGYETRRLDEEDPANFEATERLANLHDRLEEGGYAGHDLQRFMVRILFCLFAEDTGIFEPDAFTSFVRHRTREDGADTGAQLNRMFEVLNRPVDERQANLDEDLASLPYVNGELFAEQLGFADFNRPMRTALLKCCNFRWEKISPAVFGSLFQNIIEPRDRRQIGAHYTSERDIMKLIRSLFLDDLRADFESIRTDRRALARFQRRLGELRLLDPACGCGNFLVIAYRELRRLELDVLQARFGDEPSEGDIRAEARLNVGQFYGIEIEEWPVRIAEVGMWLMDHQMNNELFERFGQQKATTPLTRSPHVVQGNALRIDWNEVLPAQECTYVLGNPPFVGKHYRTPEQSADLRAAAAGFRNIGDVDYVAGWYFKSLQYAGRAARIAFVSTNSITQGEQVAILWPELVARHPTFERHFAHRTFAWISEARGRAHVHVVIVGFGHAPRPQKHIHEYSDPEHPTVATVPSISPYLTAGPASFVVRKSQRPIANVPKMRCGNKPTDGGHLLLDENEKAELVSREPSAAAFVRRFVGSDEFINGIQRSCLWLVDATPEQLRRMPLVLDRVARVRQFRLDSTAEPTRRAARTPTRFFFISQPDTEYIAIPEVSSENREYVPIGILGPEVIASNKLYVIADPSRFLLGVLSSAMHMAWMRQVGGRLESRYQYSGSIVYNPFPWPQAVTDDARGRVEDAAQGVLDARAQFPDATLADLYDPNAMPVALRRAHERLDRAVDACYRRQPFTSERQRLEYLFGLYEQLVAPLTGAAAGRRRRRG